MTSVSSTPLEIFFMLDRLWRRVLIAITVMAFAAGCSGSPTSPPFGQTSVTASSANRASPGMRVLHGPAIIGNIAVPLVAHSANLPRRWPKTKSGQILFVTDVSDNQVLMYDPKIANSPPLGSITKGLDAPIGLALDKHGKLYVTNLDNNTVTVYPRGSSSPSLTIPNGLNAPFGIGVDSKRDVFVANTSGTVVGFKPGRKSPFETIDFSSEGQPTGLAIDASDNVWVACDNTDSVWKIPPGSSTPQNADLSGLGGPLGVSFGKNGMMYVSNYSGGYVTIYARGATAPARTLSSGIISPVFNGFAPSGRFFQSNAGLNVVGYKGYKKNQAAPFSTITGNPQPWGIAGYPLIKR
jgi:hypothetical protein